MPVNRYRTMTEAIADLRRRGYSGSFEPEDGRLRLVETGRAYAPDELTVREHHRFEGQTNPDDMSVVYALESGSGDRGIVIDAFGAYADPVIGEVLGRAERREDV